MGLNPPNSTFGVPNFVRSRESENFEAAWRSICGGALVPHKNGFSPRPFMRLLRDIVLLDFAASERPWSRIRVVGDGIRERVQSDLTSHDYLEFLPEKFHEGSVESLRLIYSMPCGLWQVMAAHYARGFSQYLELTAFPLKTDDGHQLLCHLAPLRGHVSPMPKGLTVMSMDTAAVFKFLDVGAGVPEWPPAKR